MVKGKDEIPDPLLDEADFLRLMEAEFKSSGKAEDVLEKQRIWTGLQQKLPMRKKSFSPAWLLVAVLMLGIIPFWRGLDHQGSMDIKGEEPWADVQLDVQLLDQDQRPQPLEQLKHGQILLFKVSSTTASYLALTLQIDGGNPVVVFQRKAPLTGRDMILGEDGAAYVYELDQPGQSLKFCLLAAGSRDELQQKVSTISQQLPLVGAHLCRTLVVP